MAPTSIRAQGFCRILILVGLQVVQYVGGAGLELRHQHLAHVCCEGRAIHRSLYDPWGDQPVLGQPRDQRLRAPTAKGRIHSQSLAALGSAPQTCEIGSDGCFINKHYALRLLPNRWQPMGKPISALMPYLGTAALRRDHDFFCT